MSLLRASVRLSSAVRQCTRLTSAQMQQRRRYADMSFTFASSVETYYDQARVEQVDVPSFSGSFGILPDHVPLLAVLKPGLLTVTEEGGSKKNFFVSSGSVTINDDSSVQILAEEATTVDRLDPQAIRDGLARATQEVQSASSETAKAEAEVGVECYEALQKAIE